MAKIWIKSKEDLNEKKTDEKIKWEEKEGENKGIKLSREKGGEIMNVSSVWEKRWRGKKKKKENKENKRIRKWRR